MNSGDAGLVAEVEPNDWPLIGSDGNVADRLQVQIFVRLGRDVPFIEMVWHQMLPDRAFVVTARGNDAAEVDVPCPA